MKAGTIAFNQCKGSIIFSLLRLNNCQNFVIGLHINICASWIHTDPIPCRHPLKNEFGSKLKEQSCTLTTNDFLLQILGKGAFGKVYLAYAQGLFGEDKDLPVAVKQLKGTGPTYCNRIVQSL